LKIFQVRILVLCLWALVIGWWLFSPQANYQTRPASAGTDAGGAPLYWYKGNTHSHARLTVEDYTHGDSTVSEVAGWYRDHGYHFTAITDHNRHSDGSALVGHPGQPDFLLLAGMEVTSDHRYPGVMQDGERKIHATALNVPSSVEWDFDTPGKSKILTQQASRIRAAGGLPIINHPNYRFQLELADLLEAKHVNHLEIFNAHPRSNHAGHAGFRPGVEELWDQLLSRGRLFYGVAADDAHDFSWYWQALRRFGTSPPGGAWIMTMAPQLTPDHITAAISHGNFYSSTGVHLKKVSVKDGFYALELDLERTRTEIGHSWVRDAAPVVWSDDSHHVIEFIGKHGRVLLTTHNQDKAGIRMKPEFTYVRARVSWLEKLPSLTGADRARAYYAWTQPVMTGAGVSAE
jgi:hypothetical protein